MDCGSWYGHKEESEILPAAKTSLLKKNRKSRKKQKEHLKGEMDPAKRGTGMRMMRYEGRGFKDRAFAYSYRWACTDRFD